MGRGRCPEHGLFMSHAGGCIRCPAAPEPPRSRALFVVLAFVVGGALAAMVGVRAITPRGEPRATAEPAVAPSEPTAAVVTVPDPTPAAVAMEDPVVAEMRQVPVRVYTAAYCGWCKKAKAHMDAQGIAYTELRIDESEATKREMNRIGGQGVPTFDIEGDVRSGYDPSWLESTLRTHARMRIAARR